ncbi:flagellar hook-associated protein 2 [Caenibacillus caldisaponilyticus]|uniref:flagellar hook-associated protein 2 n=1 Tax=Caenibacillus caldisaponilyticus TaxID=1674942 RepID=UPI0009886D08|nr:flagellar hook-associated protein 2 [Caenibacillus caldisaponilyticus]
MADSVSGISSSLTGITSSNPLRTFGLASGIDVDSIVEKLMAAERIPLTQMQQQRQLLQWQQDDYRSMNSLLLDLYNMTFDMTLQSNYLVKQAVSSNDSVVSATAKSSAPNATYLLQNGSIATAAYNYSNGSITSGKYRLDENESLWNMRGAFANDPFAGLDLQEQQAVGEAVVQNPDGSYKLAHGYIDTTQSLTFSDGAKVYYSKADYDADTTSAKKVYVNAVTGDLTFNYDPGSITADYTYATNTNTSFTVSLQTPDDNGNLQTYSWAFDGTKSLNTVISAINGSAAGVSMFFDSATGQVSITRSKTGDYNKSGAEMIFTSAFFTDTLKLDSNNEQGGTDATITINGLTTTRHDNTFTVNGVTFTLKQNITSPVTVSVTNDTDGIYDKIKAWVDKYNDTIDKINAKLSEKRYRDYPPLTDDQKKDMSEDEINLWNQKAMSGMLADDTILRDGLSQMRLELYKQVSGLSNTKYDQLAEIGIKTSSDYTQNGKLEIDEATLKQAIADDPQAVIDLFTKSGSTDDDTGLMKRLQGVIQDTMNKVKQKAGNDSSTYDQYFLGKDIHDLDERISAFEDHLNDVQNRYYAQFTAMEEAIQMANQQASYIMSFFNSGK